MFLLLSTQKVSQSWQLTFFLSNQLLRQSVNNVQVFPKKHQWVIFMLTTWLNGKLLKLYKTWSSIFIPHYAATIISYQKYMPLSRQYFLQYLKKNFPKRIFPKDSWYSRMPHCENWGKIKTILKSYYSTMKSMKSEGKQPWLTVKSKVCNSLTPSTTHKSNQRKWKVETKQQDSVSAK